MSREEIDSILSKLQIIDFEQNCGANAILNLVKDFDILLVTTDGINLLKQPNKNFEILLSVFTNLIYYDDLHTAKHFFKYFEAVIEIFRSKLPKIKKGDWWKKFELEYLVKYIPKLNEKISPSDGSWVEIWSFTANLIISDTALSTVPLNTLLSISETSFRKGKEHPEILDQGWKCWAALIDAFGRSPKILLPSKTLNLLMKPLLACYSVSKLRISTWIHLIEVKGVPSTGDTIKQLVEPFCKAMYTIPGEKAISRHLPEESAEALIKLLSYPKVVELCLEAIVAVFGACLNSRPAVGTLERLACAIIKAVNDCENEEFSFKQWKSLIEQYKSCNISPIVSQACQFIFKGIHFQRWLDSGMIESTDLNEFIDCSDFRSEILLRLITSLSICDDESNTPKKKNKKVSPETLWNHYCEAYMSWWSNQSPPIPRENDENSPEFPVPSRNGHDYQAMLALVLYPIQLNSWSCAISKTWTKICETSNKHRLLQLMIEQIFGALEVPQLQVLKAIDVLNILFGINPNLCKASNKILEALVPKVYGMERKHITDLLNLCEIAVASVELSVVVSKMLNNINEVACSETDQLDAHKIRTKVGKLTRKMEQLSNSEKDKPAKAQRTPFRTQSNFLQRLAKAEEKNKTKNTFLSSIFSSNEKNKCDDSGEVDNGISELSLQNTSLDKLSDEQGSKKSLKLLDDSENVSINMPLMSPSILKESLSTVNGENNHCEVIAAEKENVIVQSSTAPPAISSPANKMKITNARELKNVDGSSPTMNKKSKLLAGQKVTPKKVTPSKVVSYFDDDANDCVMVPAKPKTTPLTEHQMEMMTKRRTDIPAMYQDLSQDTQVSNPPCAIVQQMKKSVSPQETEDLVLITPSPTPIILLTRAERPKINGKMNSAKKLDFNSHEDPSLDASRDNGVLSRKDSSLISIAKLDCSSNIDSDGLLLENGPVDHSEKKEYVPLTDVNCVKGDQSIVSHKVPDPSPITPREENRKSAGHEKSKRNRKSEPSKFSPKQTRSKKSLRSTPDANLSKPLTSESCKVAKDKTVNNKEVTEKMKSEESLGEKTDAPSASLVNGSVEDDGKKRSINGLIDTGADLVCDDGKPIDSQVPSEISEDRDKSSTSRKRKFEDVPISDCTKKSKPADEETPSKKACLLKKKKKLFKLSSGNNNLENWLVKTERVPNSNSPSTLSVKNEESSEEMSSEPGFSEEMEEPVIDLNNSEEIVPSTQELDTSTLLESTKSISSCKIQEERPQQVDESERNTVDFIMKGEIRDEKLQDPCDVDETESIPLLGHQESDSASPDPIEKCSKENGNSVLKKLAQDSPNDDDDVDLIICSPTKRHRRATSVLRGEGDTYLTKEKFSSYVSEETDVDSLERSIRHRGRTPSPSTQSKKRIYPPSGRSARMLRLAASTTLQEEESGFVTPTRKRENIVPMTYGENWPKGPAEDWVACTPLSPYTSPFRSVLKRTPAPGDECQVTPQRCTAESLVSPLLSSAKRKRVMFLDPPVTKGLIYERDSPFGAVHLADIPQGSPYPTWKGDENATHKIISLANSETTPESHVELITPSISEEVNKLIDGPKIQIPSNELEYSEFKNKYRLEDDFIQQLSQLSLFIRGLVTECFENDDMEATIDGWKLGDCRKMCELPQTFLSLVKNERGQSLIELLKAVNLIPTVAEVPIIASSESQTDPTNVPITHFGCQTELETRAVGTNTITIETATTSTQADQELPPPNEVLPIFVRYGPRKTLEYCSEYLKILSSVPDLEK